MTTENLRCEARLPARVPVLLVRGRRVIPFETGDVSFRGLFLRTSEPPSVRSLVRLRVALPTREIEAHAMVVHVVDGASDLAGLTGVGLQLWGLAGPDRSAWDDFVRTLITERRAAAKRASIPPFLTAASPIGTLGAPPTPFGHVEASTHAPISVPPVSLSPASVPPPSDMSKSGIRMTAPPPSQADRRSGTNE